MDLKGHEPYRGSPINGAPSHTFLPLGLGRVSCLRHKMRNTFVWMGAYKPPSSSIVGSWWRSRGRAPWKLQRICILWYLNLGLILPINTWMVYAFFSCVLQYKITRISQRSQIFNSQVSYQKKCSVL